MTNDVSVMKMLRLYRFIIAHTWPTSSYPAHKPQAVSDWLNQRALRTISAFGYIDNLA